MNSKLKPRSDAGLLFIGSVRITTIASLYLHCMRKNLFLETKNILLIFLGMLSAGMGIKGYLTSSHFIDGGVTGISMLLNDVLGWPLYLTVPLINLPFVVTGYFQMGWKFALKTQPLF